MPFEEVLVTQFWGMGKTAEAQNVVAAALGESVAERRRRFETTINQAFSAEAGAACGIKAFVFCVEYDDATQFCGCSANFQEQKDRVARELSAKAFEETEVEVLDASGQPKPCSILFGSEGAQKSRSKFKELHPLVARLMKVLSTTSRSQDKEPDWWPAKLAGKYAARTKELGIDGCVAVMDAIFAKARRNTKLIKELQRSLTVDFKSTLSPYTVLVLDSYFRWLDRDAASCKHFLNRDQNRSYKRQRSAIAASSSAPMPVSVPTTDVLSPPVTQPALSTHAASPVTPPSVDTLAAPQLGRIPALTAAPDPAAPPALPAGEPLPPSTETQLVPRPVLPAQGAATSSVVNSFLTMLATPPSEWLSPRGEQQDMGAVLTHMLSRGRTVAGNGPGMEALLKALDADQEASAVEAPAGPLGAPPRHLPGRQVVAGALVPAEQGGSRAEEPGVQGAAEASHIGSVSTPLDYAAAAAAAPGPSSLATDPTRMERALIRNRSQPHDDKAADWICNVFSNLGKGGETSPRSKSPPQKSRMGPPRELDSKTLQDTPEARQNGACLAAREVPNMAKEAPSSLEGPTGNVMLDHYLRSNSGKLLNRFLSRNRSGPLDVQLFDELDLEHLEEFQKAKSSSPATSSGGVLFVRDWSRSWSQCSDEIVTAALRNVAGLSDPDVRVEEVGAVCEHLTELMEATHQGEQQHAQPELPRQEPQHEADLLQYLERKVERGVPLEEENERRLTVSGSFGKRMPRENGGPGLALESVDSEVSLRLNLPTDGQALTTQASIESTAGVEDKVILGSPITPKSSVKRRTALGSWPDGRHGR